MKKIVFATVSALTLAAVAVDSTQFGVLKVPSSAKETIVSVPWLESGTGDTDIAVSNMVLTAGLEIGDLLKYYDGSAYVCWQLAQGTDAKYWQSVTMVGTEVSVTENPSTATIKRGKAIILDRCGTRTSGTRDLSNGFHIMGKPFSGTEEAVTLSGSTTAPTYSLVAPPSVSAVDVNTGITWSGITKYDSLMLSDGSSLVWSGDKWYKRVNNEWTSSDITIPAGTGAWFIGRSTGDKNFKIK